MIIFCLLLWIPSHVLAVIVFNPFISPVNILETVTKETFLETVDCTAVQPDYCSCNLVNRNAGEPFDVWKRGDFGVYYVGAAAGGPLSYKTKSTYYLTVQCQDSNQTPVQRILEVDVMPNHPPVFQVNTASVNVKVPANDGHLVYAVSATDADGDPLTYSVKDTAPSVNYFRIDPKTGRITVSTTTQLYTATESQVLVTIRVSDDYSQVDNFQLSVNITDVNQRPDIRELPTTLHVLENAAIGSNVIALTIVDNAYPFPQTPPSCTVLPANERFRFKFAGFNPFTITLAAALDYESTNAYTIFCDVTDGYLNSVGEVLNLVIDNVNEPPQFDDVAYYCVLEESNAGISSCDLGFHDILTDPEGDVITSVGFVNGNNSYRFRYMRAANRVTFNVDYDVDASAMPTNVVLQLQATDVHGASSRVPVYITVLDANDNTCYFRGGSVTAYTVNQATSIGILGRLVATDDDLTSPNNMVTYDLVQGVPPDSINYMTFYSDGTLVYTAPIPDSSQPKTYSLTVRCKDGGTPRKSAEATVALTYLPTTTTSTTTTTTTTPTTTTTTTTPTTTTTTEKARDIWDDSAFVGTFATLMCLLVLGLLAVLWLCAKYCLPSMSLSYSSASTASGFRDFCCPKPKPRKVQPEEEDTAYTIPARTNPDYQDDYWRQGDKFETGREPTPVKPAERVFKPTPPESFQL